jgi:hypothetical protein
VPHISTRRLHTRDYMSRVLRRAGQFAHVSVRDIDAALSQLYSDKYRCSADDYIDHGDYLSSAKRAVPETLIKLYKSGAISMMYDAEGVVHYIAGKHGLLCGLCYSVETSRWPSGGNMLAFLVTPTYLALQPAADWKQGTLCNECWSSIHRVYGNGPWWHESREMLLSAIARLLTLQSFRQRVAANKRRRLRFDPRRPLWAATEGIS